MKNEAYKKKIVINTIKASAGFPSPAENYIEERLDLNKYLLDVNLKINNLLCIQCHWLKID